MPEALTVVIPSARSDTTLRRAVASVLAQDYSGPIQTLVVRDPVARQPTDKAASRRTPPLSSDLAGRRVETVPTEHARLAPDPSDRIAQLRNFAIEQAEGDLIAFLDDDNYYLPHHLSTLVRALTAARADTAHSWRRIEDAFHAPWFADRDPWASSSDLDSDFARLVRQGLLIEGSALLRDRVRLRHGGVGMVDTSCWLFRASVIRDNAFPVGRTERDRAQRVTEDDRLLARLVRQGVVCACSYRATVVYRLGGYSNA